MRPKCVRRLRRWPGHIHIEDMLYISVANMNEDIALHILSIASSGTLGTRDLVDATGRSPNTVVRYLRELEARGLVRRRVAGKIGAGRPRVLCELTEAGVGRVRLGELGLFAKLDREARIAWGPLRSFAFWGVPFIGTTQLKALAPHSLFAGPVVASLASR